MPLLEISRTVQSRTHRELFGRLREPRGAGGQLARSLWLGRVCVVSEARGPGCEDSAERGRAVQSDPEVPSKQSAQNLVCELGDLRWPGRVRCTGHHRVDRAEHLGAALEGEAGASGILPDDKSQEVDAPQRARETARARPCPEFGERVEAVGVRVADEPLKHCGIVALPSAADERVRGVVRDPENLRRVFSALVLVELIARVLGGLVEVVGHRVNGTLER